MPCSGQSALPILPPLVERVQVLETKLIKKSEANNGLDGAACERHGGSVANKGKMGKVPIISTKVKENNNADRTVMRGSSHKPSSAQFSYACCRA